MINKATDMYSITLGYDYEDVFDGFTTDDARLEELVSTGFLGSVPEPQYQGAEFQWDIESQEWIYVNDAAEGYTNYVFSELDVDDFDYTNTWTNGEDGFSSTYGLLFVDNDKSEYTVTSTATLSEGDAGGYGVLFETSVDEDDNDSGYVLQFDRGYGSILIRKRVDGKEENPIVSVDNSDNSIIPSSKRDDWWTEEHDIKLEVSNVSGQDDKKYVTVSVDGDTVIEKLMVDANEDVSSNVTGFRSWGSETTYSELTVE
jgi:hypothetical protein